MVSNPYVEPEQLVTNNFGAMQARPQALLLPPALRFLRAAEREARTR